MNIRNCKMCGKIYNYIVGANLCPSCRDQIEDQFQLVKKYIYEHPGASISEVAEENEVSIPQIRQWVREERLEFTADSVTGVNCENCGSPIRTGRFCKRCKDQMIHTLGSVYPDKGQDVKTNRSNARMRYFES